jgi:glycine betaine/proline transport system substrate-binding protein
MVRPRKIKRRTFLITGAAGLVFVPPIRCKSDEPLIVLGQVSLSFYAVTGAVVRKVLECLGHSVEVREGPHEAMFPLLANGAIDLLAAVWLPEGHATYWASYGRDAEEIASLTRGPSSFGRYPIMCPKVMFPRLKI